MCAASRTGSSSPDGSGSVKTTRSLGLIPRLLHVLATLDVTDGADMAQTPGWLGFEGTAPSDALIVGGSWDGWRDHAPDAWRPSSAADMSARSRPFHGDARE
jgi:hypothetical protein